MALYEDLAWFESNRQWIANTYPGKWILVKNKAVVGAYPTQDAAFKAGLLQFGQGNFAIKEAATSQRVEYGVLGRVRLAQGYQQPLDVVEQLRRDGAVVDVVISAPASQSAAGQGTAGTSQTVRGMIDTGASISTVSDAVAAGAGLVQTGSVPLGGVGGTSERPIYAASFTLPKWGVTVDPIEVAGVTIPMPGIDILVGRDILRAIDLSYRGPAGAFSLVKGEGGSAPEEQQVPGSPEAARSGAPWLPIAAGVGILGIGALFALKVI